MLARPVTESGQLRHILRVAHKALSDGVHGVFVREGTFELSDLDAEEIKFLPFTPPVDHSDGEAVILTRGVFVERVAIDLHLEFIGKVFRRMAVNRDTGQAKIERIAFCVFLIAGLILQHTVSA